jgi:hypothetical protein
MNTSIQSEPTLLIDATITSADYTDYADFIFEKLAGSAV